MDCRTESQVLAAGSLARPRAPRVRAPGPPAPHFFTTTCAPSGPLGCPLPTLMGQPGEGIPRAPPHVPHHLGVLGFLGLRVCAPTLTQGEEGQLSVVQVILYSDAPGELVTHKEQETRLRGCAG